MVTGSGVVGLAAFGKDLARSAEAAIVGLALWLGTCLASCGAAPPPLPARWQWRPVSVLIRADLPALCQEYVRDGLDFWDASGVKYLQPTTIDPSDPRALAPGLATILITAQEPDGDTYLASTVPVSLAGNMVSATVRLGRYCSPWVAAHELGHALGLAHSAEPGNVMESVGTGYGLTPSQLEAVR